MRSSHGFIPTASLQHVPVARVSGSYNDTLQDPGVSLFSDIHVSIFGNKDLAVGSCLGASAVRIGANVRMRWLVRDREVTIKACANSLKLGRKPLLKAISPKCARM